MSDYVADYKAALGLFELLTSGRKAAKGDIRTALIGLFVADGTVREKAKATGVSVSKVQKDVVAGEWLSTHPKADALEVKKATDVLPATTIRACNSLADLQAAVKAMKAGKKDNKPEETGDTEETGEPEEPKTPKTTTPDSQMLGLVPGMLKTAKNVHDRKPISAETRKKFQEALAALAKEWNEYVTEIQAATDAA